MTNRRGLIVCLLVLLASFSGAQAQQPQTTAQASGPTKTPTPAQAPDVSGEWSGVWSGYNPAKPETKPIDLCSNLVAKIEQKNGAWQASFEGNCGRPYKYEIKMEGRQVGKVIMFKGTTDLGAQDGGVYDWIGRANESSFVGFFTSAGYTGTFNMTRKAK